MTFDLDLDLDLGLTNMFIEKFCQTLELWGQHRPITEGLTEGWMENASDIISDRLTLDGETADRLTWASETDRKSLS